MEANEISLPLQTDQQVKKKKPVEIHNYPKEFIIQYSDIYWIYYRDKFQYHIKSEKLSLNAACLYTKNNRAKKIAKSISTIFDQVKVKDCHSDDNLSLKSIEFDIRNNFFYLSVNKENIKEIKYKAKAAVQACDKGQVSCEGYRILASISQDLSHVINPKIHLRISDDGRNVRQKVKQVMITCSILDDIDNLYQPENHYTIVLYPGVKKYETLNNILKSLAMKLRKLKEEGFKDNQNIKWKVELYFSSDWKFLAMCLGLNAANSITDILWRLVFDKLRSRNTWKEKARNVIIEEMKRIDVKFYFWLEVESINCLWDKFYLLHKAIKDSKTDATQFSNDACAWLYQFLDFNYLYQASDIIPYMHILVYHISEMMRIHYNFGTTKDGGTGKE
ncbi:hypothetical protein GLOIN_2v1763508 [Rhizophagus irregularis DAOM 181602=DAOM 197198]|nr:hypothetical protein GLOIN_2v1763508 [Rhizophagus irregularis DAOM 181602=DAOM 197198]